MNTKDFEKLQRKLKDHNIAAVARATGLHKNTIYRIMRGEAKNPSYCTVQTLLEYLKFGAIDGWHEIRESDKAGNEKLSRGRLTRKLFR